MNQLQISLLEIIISLAKLDQITKHKGDTFYPFCNYVRRFALAEDEYFISEAALDIIKDHNHENKFYRKWKNSNGRYKIKYDHAVPANVIAKLIIDNKNNIVEIAKILQKTSIVVILTPLEDKLLSSSYRSQMPSNWNYKTGDPWQRYRETKIIIPKKNKLKMCGALCI